MKKIFLGIAALSLAFLLAISGMCAFSDIKNDNVKTAAETLNSMAIVTGTTATAYAPDNSLTRAEFCALAVRAMGLDEDAKNVSIKKLFTDVSPKDWYNGYVTLSYEKGLVNGYGNGKFGPDDKVTYAQLITMLTRMLGYTSADVGNLWPDDYVIFANKLELNENVSLSANDYVLRGDAAIILYNAIRKNTKQGMTYYKTSKNNASFRNAIIIDTDDNGRTKFYAENGKNFEYADNKNKISDFFEGMYGNIAFDKDGKVSGFVPDDGKYVDITVRSAKTSGITSNDGITYKVNSNANVIIGTDSFVYGVTGASTLDNYKGRKVRLFINGDNSVTLIYSSFGSTSSDMAAYIVNGETVSDLAHSFNIEGTYNITKNSRPADTADITKNDTVYYVKATNTMAFSDYKITGIIENAIPDIDGATSITVSGCTLPVLESAWVSLENFKYGDSVTLLLTDDLKVVGAKAASYVKCDPYAVLSQDKRSVTFAKTGLTVRADSIDADDTLIGSLVKVTGIGKDTITCKKPELVSGTINVTVNTLGKMKISSDVRIYEWCGSGFVYDLEGNPGMASIDFDDINLTSIPSANVSFYSLNSAGKVDVILLSDVTGNCYAYGKITKYEKQMGVAMGNALNPAISITNSTNTGMEKIISNIDFDLYSGVGTKQYSQSVKNVSGIKELDNKTVGKSDIVKEDDSYYILINGKKTVVSEKAEIYIPLFKEWYHGYDNMSHVMSDDYNINVYYSSDLNGETVRIIVLSKN